MVAEPAEESKGSGWSWAALAGALLGLGAVAVAVARRDSRLVAGLVLIALGAIGLIVHDDPLAVFLPFIATGTAILALTLQRVSS
jgi:hypothetical protein